MSMGIEPGILADLLMVAITFIATVANILLWFTTRATLKILVEQMQHQSANSYRDIVPLGTKAESEL
jgi:hypothetical protein